MSFNLAPIRVEISGTAVGLVAAAKQAQAALQGLAASGDSLQNIGRNMTNVGRTLTQNVTLPLAAIGYASVKMAAQYEDSLSQIQGATRASADEMARVDKYIMRITENSVYGPREVSEAWLSLAKGGLTQAQIKAGALQTALDLATASGMALGDSADIITRGAKTFNLSVADIPRVADSLVGAADASTANVQDLAAAFTQTAAAASASGFSIEETAAGLALLSDTATNIGTDAGTALKTFLARLTPANLGTIEKYGLSFTTAAGNIKGLIPIQKELQRATDDMTQAQKKQFATEVFGSDAGRAALALMNGRVKATREYLKAAKDEQAAERASEARLGKISESLKKAQVAIERAGIQIGRALGPSIESAAKWIGDLANKFSKLDQGTKDFIVKAGLIAAALGPVLVVAGSTATAIGGIIKAFNGVKKGVDILRGVNKAMPCGKVGPNCLDGIPGSAEKAKGSLRGLMPFLAQASVPIFLGVALPALTNALGEWVAREKPEWTKGFGGRDPITGSNSGYTDGRQTNPVPGRFGRLDPTQTQGGNEAEGWKLANQEYQRYRNQAQAQGKGILPKVKPQVDASDLLRQTGNGVARATAEASRKKANRIKLQADAGEVTRAANKANAQIDKVGKGKSKIKIGADAGAAIGAAKKAETAIDKVKQRGKPKISADDGPAKNAAKNAQSNIDRIKQGRKPIIDADEAQALSAVDTVYNSLSNLVSSAWNVVITVTQDISQLAGKTLDFFFDTRSVPVGGGQELVQAADVASQVDAFGAASRRGIPVNALPTIFRRGANRVAKISVVVDLKRTGDWEATIKDQAKLERFASDTDKKDKARAKAAKQELEDRKAILEEARKKFKTLGAAYDGEKQNMRQLTAQLEKLRNNYRALRTELQTALMGVEIGTAWGNAQSSVETFKSELEDLTKSTLPDLRRNLSENAWNPDAVIYYEAEIKKVQDRITQLQGMTTTEATAFFTKAELDKQLAQVQSFTNNVQKLKAKGLSTGALQQLISVGPAEGAAIAEALAKPSGKALFDTFSSAYEESRRLSNAVGQEIAQDVFRKPLEDVNRAMGTIISRIDKWLSKQGKKTIKVDFKFDAGIFEKGITGGGTTASKNRSGAANINYTINVNAGLANPEETAREIENVLASHSARMGGWA